MRNSKIEWTDDTDNIIVAVGGGWWCRKISPECDHCYAEMVNNNDFFNGNHMAYKGEPPQLMLRRDILAKWRRQTVPRKHFVMSLSDVFGEWVPRAWHFEMLDAMAAAPMQTFQVLTKRVNVMQKSVKLWMGAVGLRTPPKNIWLGFTAGDQKRFDKRWQFALPLAQMGWTVFVSAEPLLSSIELPESFLSFGRRAQVIVGGESGSTTIDPATGKRVEFIPRPMHPEWVRNLRDQCRKYDVSYFFKQWGEWLPDGGFDVSTDEGLTLLADCDLGKYQQHQWWKNRGRAQINTETSYRVGKKLAGRMLDGQTWSEFPKAA